MMAKLLSNHSFSFFVFFFLALLFQTSPLSLDNLKYVGPAYPHYEPYRPKPNSNFTVVDLGKVRKALWDSDYRIMSLLVERELPYFLPFATDWEALPRQITSNLDTANSIILFDENAVTVFAPRDEAFRLEDVPWISVDNQFLTSKIHREDFESGVFPNGTKLATCNHDEQYVLVTEKFGEYFISGVKVKRWNIYDDGHVIVHGVDEFFRPTRPRWRYD